MGTTPGRRVRRPKGSYPSTMRVDALREALGDEQLLDRAVCFVDRLIRERRRAGVGVRDRDAAKPLPPEYMRPLFRRNVRICERVIGIGISVRPPVHSDADDVRGGVESAGGEHPSELTADL